jgi:leader peptidase (prepilin peptidase)/N-methyltransferase
VGESGQLIMSPIQASLVAATAAVAASPLLASWTVALVHDVHRGWWRPRHVGPARWSVVAVLAGGFAALGARGAPLPAWWVFAVAGAVLSLVDGETYRLPARLVAPLAVAEVITLAASAAALHQPERLLRAGMATAVVAGGYFLIAFAAPTALGLGDVYVAGITAGLLGWLGWRQVLLGQSIMLLLGPLLLAGVALARPTVRGWRMHIPLGPALVAGALLACWA